MRMSSWWVVPSMLGLSSFAGAQVPQAGVSSLPLERRAKSYVDEVSYFQTEAEFQAWFELRAHLRQNFDDICGDTFCEGDYGNIESIVFRCSVETRTGVIGQCLWVFGGSAENIDSRTGVISTQTRTWACRSPLARGTTMAKLLTALAGPEPLYATLPGTSTTLYDGLVDCL
ncbi:hypothetical protein HUA76_16985 [Myxococcus sp. CA056]|uniref:hypothetical protein n=1 Tax=Myxococcus sp. CA056 TaxID=2741740 RepID=UPI00157B6453|nr:hypothetical protein [Myxococcus sp. CA056]NTX12494.1 hypothetical protein [Myxococcus sp. CA056]